MALAARLRAVQASWAEEEPDARQLYLEEEMERALDGLAPDDRKACLDALAALLPETGETAESGKPPPAPATSPSDWPVEKLVRELGARAANLDPERRAALAAALAEAGLVKAAGDGGSADLPEDFRRRLRLPAGKPVAASHANRLLLQLLETTLTLDQLVWNIWKNLAPGSRLRRDASGEGDFRTLTGRYLTGDAEVSFAQVAQALESSRQLIAGLLGALGPVGRGYARKTAGRFSPEAIRELVKLEPGGFLTSPDAKCWKKFCELAGELEEAAVERDIHQAIVGYAEELVLGPGGKSTSTTT